MAPTKKKNGKKKIRIRMYRVGFGDFFLVTFGANTHVIIDCGVFKGTSGTGDIGSLDAAIDNMLSVTGGKIALIVMTHRHADHIAGFGRAADRLAAALKTEAVFLPIWETEYDDRAKKFQVMLTGIAESLQDHLDLRLAANKSVDEELYHQVGNATGREAPILAAKGDKKPKKTLSKNKLALELLKSRLGVEPQCLSCGDTPKLPKSLRDAGVSVQVLGPPPIENVDLMKLMDLEKGVGQFLALAAATDSDDTAIASKWVPFSPEWHVKPTDAITANELSPWAFVDWMPKRGRELRDCASDEERHEIADTIRTQFEKHLDGSTPAALAMAAKKLDGFLNNQSLVLLFTYAGRNLLFAGDAQAGNWEHWLFETDTPDKSASLPLSRNAREILENVDVYKVGHHGSTNSTPKIVAETLRKGAVALCSTEAKVYGKTVATAVPLVKLMDAIADGRTLIRSDGIPVKVNGKAVKTQVTLPKGKVKGLKAGALWIDYELDGV